MGEFRKIGRVAQFRDGVGRTVTVEGRDIAVIPMGSLDDVPAVLPSGHIYVGSKAPWYTIADALVQHQEMP